VRFGLKSQVQNALKESPNVVNELDSSGCSAAHWASKRGDIEMLEILYSFGANLSLVSNSESQMCPIHWAASEGKLASVAFLLDRKVDINIQDANGCTPVIIATQHNHQECVVYFIHKGADMTLSDNNGDTAIHWSAYKGFVEMTGLLAHSMPRAINSTDNFGQVPLHLAALRGNHDVVEYLIYDCNADVSLKDKNGLNPLELSIKKNQLKCEWVLRKKAYRHWLGILRSLSTNRLRDSRIVRFFLCGSNEKEISAWPWRIVFLSNLLASYTTVIFATSESLVDLYYLHLFNSMVSYSY
jgi:ankyrin repeat protein